VKRDEILRGFCFFDPPFFFFFFFFFFLGPRGGPPGRGWGKKVWGG